VTQGNDIGFDRNTARDLYPQDYLERFQNGVGLGVEASQKLRQRIIAQRGYFPDSSLDIAEDRRR